MYFITGTDTNVGKTVAASYLAYHLKAAYFKPIQSGEPTDFEWVATHDFSECIYPPIYQFKEPLSPNQAAAAEGKILDINHLENSIHQQIKAHYSKNTPLIIEGAGGLYVPLKIYAPKSNQQPNYYCILDLLCFLHQGFHHILKIIMVCRASLGTINHTLLSIEALRRRGIESSSIHIMMMGDKDDEGDKNKENIEMMTGIKVFRLPYFDQSNPHLNCQQTPEFNSFSLEKQIKNHKADWLKYANFID